MANRSLEKAKGDSKQNSSAKKSPEQLQAILTTIGQQASQLHEKKDSAK